MDIDEPVEGRREQVLRLATAHGAHRVRVFGSAARGEAGPDSDIDFLVEFESGRGLLDLVGLIDDLRVLLGRNVDVAEPEGLHWTIRERVLRPYHCER
jgi:predicted nucleotidyltransferase